MTATSAGTSLSWPATRRFTVPWHDLDSIQAGSGWTQSQVRPGLEEGQVEACPPLHVCPGQRLLLAGKGLDKSQHDGPTSQTESTASEGLQERSHILWSPQLRCPGGHGHMKKLCSQGKHSLVLSRAQKICKCVSKGTTLSSAAKVRPTRSRGEGSGAPPLTPRNSIVGCACCAFHRCQGQNVQA